MNSKFGDCCNCPALVDGRYFTEYADRDTLQFNIMKNNNLTDSNQFRNFLITNGASIITSNISTLETNYKCKYEKPNDQTNIEVNSGKYINNVLEEPTVNIAPFPGSLNK